MRVRTRYWAGDNICARFTVLDDNAAPVDHLARSAVDIAPSKQRSLKAGYIMLFEPFQTPL